MAITGVTTTSSMSGVTAREVDFVTRFADNWQALTDILGIVRPIKKAPGTQLVSYTVEPKTGLAAQVGEGQEITYTEFKVTPKSYGEITIEKEGKSVSIEAIAKYGAAIAIEKTDDEFLVQLQNKVLTKFYTFLATGTLTKTETTWQRALAKAKGLVLNKFSKMNKAVTDVVAFANVMDYYDYVGNRPITVQTYNGIQYVKDFMGYNTVLLLDEDKVPVGKVFATPVENIDLYYVDPSDSEFARAGLIYTTAGDTNLIGFHVEGDYSRAAGDSWAIMGLTLWAEYLDGIAVVTVSAEGIGG